MPKLTLKDLDLPGKCVLVRVDFNVPLQLSEKTSCYEVVDDTRIRAALPTIQTITQAGGKAVLLSHLGRPKGQPDPQYSLAPVADCLSELLGTTPRFSSETIGPVVQKTVRNMPNGSVILLENTRYFPGETKNDPDFAAELAKLGDLFVNDAFGTAHRAHASNVGVASHLSLAAAGHLLEKELVQLGHALKAPTPPTVALLGGAKVSDKIGVITNLLEIVDHILIGGAMAYTFLKAKGIPIGSSLVEEDRLSDALAMLDRAQGKLLLPSDHIVSTALDASEESKTVSGSIEDGFMGLDIGPETVHTYTQKVQNANTCIWNGPMGVFEVPSFASGTKAMAQAMASATRNGAVTIIGGGDSVAAIKQLHLHTEVTHVSTGGGAMLQFLEGKSLPGLDALTDQA
ncbi:MAG: phosphoglycerate kinase [Rhodothermaceae bacterium]|nr:phosphoglycerate kinase [Rhodothermaceae bacterium]MXZ58563.1 phosphoglycerate kinase [Rhodothermaceae bacterium]MYB91878.1 phosphoglycerate kinase [Rhodothermaceae bacterium]MYD68089.1 phosphoglycerate kinase [Rhodothermaceae bacterium]MYG44457.1 phosphoglycerate kinase [Rhodothermaceae bacterium]